MFFFQQGRIFFLIRLHNIFITFRKHWRYVHIDTSGTSLGLLTIKSRTELRSCGLRLGHGEMPRNHVLQLLH